MHRSEESNKFESFADYDKLYQRSDLSQQWGMRSQNTQMFESLAMVLSSNHPRGE